MIKSKKAGDFPDFLIIGAQKCGTTSLYNYLIKHPEILEASRKEIHFFDNNYNKGIEWYKKQFPLETRRKQGYITGEATPKYIYDPNVPQRVYHYMPNVKLIVLLRNPVDRAYSNYHMDINKKLPELLRNESINDYISFEEALEVDIGQIYMKRGMYADQLERWLKFFPKSQMLILQSEQFFSNPLKTLKEVQRFLGVPYREIYDYKVYMKGDYKPINTNTRKKLLSFFKPYNDRLNQLLKVHFHWDE
ncbi:sulfotransferase domain-containing protein [Metabacillus sediminilitoris]|uniref:Sulfotransferase domain-containing protein n=1 Tax=Metabacillus sediminilitoris TaxID=2567941 RepID=A0A4S4BUZ9_9BACI|nr:sulfotransferase domain-containing protein [Metabacillus sediminilitoris]QGQ44715.1 sulfotransferase [Metabacillus sediminilitoris]THF78937.1 sulfotransferase domain-containing protein [Metabacillus sediminilitoris]